MSQLLVMIKLKEEIGYVFTRGKKYLHWKVNSFLNRPDPGFTLMVPGEFRPLYHSRSGYHGPWIENYFYGYWCGNKKKIKGNEMDRIYIPIFWTDYYLRHDRRKPNKELQEFIDENIKPDKKYFTIVQNADGIIEKLPGNILVFGAGGVGDVPVPLLKGEPRRKGNGKRNINVSFMGNIKGIKVREKMFQALQDEKDYYFGSGGLDEFMDITSRSVFTLCPRGYGRTSYRLYEAMALGSIPIYIWDDIEWLPYKDRLNWDEFSISINISDIGKLPQIIEGHTPEKVARKQKKIEELRCEYFTYEGVCRQIVRMLRERFER